MVPKQPKPSFFAPQPASIALKNPFMMFVFSVYLKVYTLFSGRKAFNFC